MQKEKGKEKEKGLSELFELIQETHSKDICSISVESHAYAIWICIGVYCESDKTKGVYHSFELDGMQSNIFLTLWELLREHIIAFKRSDLSIDREKMLWKLKKV